METFLLGVLTAMLAALLALLAPPAPPRPAPPAPVSDHDLFQSMCLRLGEGRPLDLADLDYWAGRYRTRCIYYWTSQSFEQYLHAPALVERMARREMQQHLAQTARRDGGHVVRGGVLDHVLTSLALLHN